MVKFVDLIAYAIQPALGPLADHPRLAAWALTVAALALAVWYVAGFL